MSQTPRLDRHLLAIAVAAALPLSGHGATPEPITSIEEVIVLGTQDGGVVSVGRNSLDAAEQARSIQIFDANLIQELKPANIEDLLVLSSNVNFQGNNDGRETAFVVRGFRSAPILRDGFRISSFGGITDPEVFNLERAEILKGPDSIVYGEANPGGIVNLVTKRPVAEDLTVFSLEAGTDVSWSPRFDVNRSHGDVSWRVVGLYDYDETFRDYDDANERYSLAPSLRWAPREGTVLTLIGEYVEEDRQADFGTAMSASGDTTAGPEQVNNHPQDRMDRHFYMSGIDLQQTLTRNLTAEARLRHFDAGYEYSVLFLPINYDPDTQLYMRVPAMQMQDTEEIAAQLNLFGDFELGGMRNRFTLGVDYRDTETLNTGAWSPALANTLDWTNPDYSVLPPGLEELQDFPGTPNNSERIGVFLQNHTNITDRLLLSLGVRRDDVDNTDQDYAETVMQAGIKYDVTDSLALFANFSESFNPAFALDRNGEILEPETGEGFEVGIKGELANRLTYTVAAFDITKNNVAMPDLDPNFPFASVASGEQTSRGVEIDVSGRVTDRLTLTGGMGYVDTDDEDGLEILGAAGFSSSAFATYQFHQNWNASFGFTHVGERLVVGDLNGASIYTDPHTLLNAAVGYFRGPWTVRVNVSNILDEEFINSAAGGLGRSVHPGAPLQALMTVTYTR
ncbi:MAG: TonB-dependent siderophore receptor [Pseudomonadota bacterium]